MHTVELLECALSTAQQLGYSVRHEWLGGTGGGLCEVRGRRWIFVDLALSTMEQLDLVTTVLRQDPSTHVVEVPDPLRRLLGIRRAA